jgi:preprotein translocase subunit SecY
MPYISASIIMQLLTVASPQLEALKKEGEAGVGRSLSTRVTARWPWPCFRVGIAVALESQQGLVLDPGLMFRFVTVSTLVTGTMFLMWLGEQITERGWVTASRSSSLRVLLLVCRIRSVVCSSLFAPVPCIPSRRS